MSSPLEVQIEIAECRLQVRLPEIYERGLVQIRYAKQRARDLLRSWIYHLAFCEVAPEDVLPVSILISKNAAWQFEPVEHCHKILADLINLFKSGLEKPLHLFPATSMEYAQQEQIKGKSKTAALALARRKWLGSDYSRGESDDPYYDVCFRMTDPLGPSFEDVSKAVFGPLLANGKAVLT